MHAQFKKKESGKWINGKSFNILSNVKKSVHAQVYETGIEYLFDLLCKALDFDQIHIKELWTPRCTPLYTSLLNTNLLSHLKLKLHYSAKELGGLD